MPGPKGTVLPAPIKKTFVVVNYARYVAATFMNPVTEALDAVESSDPVEAIKYETKDEAIAAMCELLVNPKFYRNGIPTIQIQKLGRMV